MDATFRGQPLITLMGESRGDSPDLEIGSKSVRLGLFWSTKGTAGTAVDDFHEQRAGSIPTMIPQSWVLNIFDPPLPELMTTMKGASARFAVGRLIAYKDANLNGKYDAGDSALGVDDGRVILYAPQAITATESPTGLDLPAGFHLILDRLACGPANLPRPSGDRDCEASIGKECQNNADCGGQGVCLHEYIMPWIKGVCAVSNPTPDSCNPKNGALLRDPNDNGSPSQGGYWIQACESSSDCGRGSPYMCDQGKKACLASEHIRVEVRAEVTIPGFCASTQFPRP